MPSSTALIVLPLLAASIFTISALLLKRPSDRCTRTLSWRLLGPALVLGAIVLVVTR